MSNRKERWLAGNRIQPKMVRGDESVADLIDNAFLAYNGRRLQQACALMTGKMLQPGCTIGVSLSGAMTPAGLGQSVLVPLIRAGFIDWIVSTGANLYHDLHFGLDLAMHQGSHELDDRVLHQDGVVRIYDILFDYEVLLQTDTFIRKILESEEFNGEMSSADLHNKMGRFLAAREDKVGVEDSCVLSTAWRCGVPCYTSSPGDSSIGMNVAELDLQGRGPKINPSLCVNETAAIVYGAKRGGGRSGVLIFGGGSPKNFMLQTEPQIQEVLGLEDAGHDYFVQITDARPDTGGLSGATPSEAVSWGKVDPERLPDAVVVYADTTIAAPLLAAYALERHKPLSHRRLYDQREGLMNRLRKDFLTRKNSIAPS
jgi:deoxyhypusine synthase